MPASAGSTRESSGSQRGAPGAWRALARASRHPAVDRLRRSVGESTDLLHVLTALWRLSGGNPDVGVPVAQIDEAIGRGHGDMRTPLNLQSLSDERLALRLPEGTWALTPQGLAWLKQDRELSDR